MLSAIFLLVVLATLGAAMLTIFSAHQVSSAMDVRGARAYQAARAGIEWGLYQQLRVGQCVPASSFALPANGSLNGFTVSVSCMRTPTPAVGQAGTSPAAPLNGTLTAGSVSVSGIADTTILAAGMSVWGLGSIVPGTRIASITGPDTLALTAGAIASGVQALTYFSALDRWSVTATACTQTTAARVCPNPAPTSPDYMEKVLQVQF